MAELWEESLSEVDESVRDFAQVFYGQNDRIKVSSVLSSIDDEPIAAYGDVAFMKRITLALVTGDQTSYDQMKLLLAERKLSFRVRIEESLIDSDIDDLEPDLDLGLIDPVSA